MRGLWNGNRVGREHLLGPHPPPSWITRIGLVWVLGSSITGCNHLALVWSLALHTMLPHWACSLTGHAPSLGMLPHWACSLTGHGAVGEERAYGLQGIGEGTGKRMPKGPSRSAPFGRAMQAGGSSSVAALSSEKG